MAVKKISKIEKDFITKKSEKTKPAAQLVTLRIPTDLLEKIDNHVNSRPLKVSRNLWILETIYKHIEDTN